MNLIDVQLKKISNEGRKGLMTHVIVGYPNLSDTKEMVIAMDKSGVDFVELQIPFSDPLADGPTIMSACEKSLENGTTVRNAFELAADLALKVDIPLLFMAYFNTVFKYGVERFCADAKKAGISGLIVPDMPLEEEGEERFSLHAKKNDLHVIRVISPASTVARIKKNIAHAGGFVYCTSRQGTTGNQRNLDPKVVEYLKMVKRQSNIPLALGFGIKNQQDVAVAHEYAEIAVVGSAIVKIAEESTGDALILKTAKFIRALRV